MLRDLPMSSGSPGSADEREADDQKRSPSGGLHVLAIEQHLVPTTLVDQLRHVLQLAVAGEDQKHGWMVLRDLDARLDQALELHRVGLAIVLGPAGQEEALVRGRVEVIVARRLEGQAQRVHSRRDLLLAI